MPQTAERRQRLWIVPGPLVVWATHFMLCYITAALWCGRVAGRLGAYADLDRHQVVRTVRAAEYVTFRPNVDQPRRIAALAGRDLE